MINLDIKLVDLSCIEATSPSSLLSILVFSKLEHKHKTKTIIIQPLVASPSPIVFELVMPAHLTVVLVILEFRLIKIVAISIAPITTLATRLIEVVGRLPSMN